MAKKKVGTGPRKAARAKKMANAAEPMKIREEWSRKPLVLQMRGTPEWKAWVEGIAEKEGDTVAKLIERTLRKFAKDNGYPDPPRR